MLRDLSAVNSDGSGICGTYLAGVLASELPTGFALPGLLNNDVLAGDPADCLYRVEIVDWPTAGTLEIAENGAFSFSGPDDTYTGATRVYKNGVADVGAYEFVIGSGGATVLVGASLTFSYDILAGDGTEPIVNDRDVLLQSAPVRVLPTTNRALILSCSSPGGFKVPLSGAASPSEITFTAALIGMTGTVGFTSSSGLTLAVSGNTATLAYASMTAESGTVTASIVVDGVPYSQPISVSKVRDGAAGADGVSPQQLYTWIRFADDATGAGISNDPTGKTHIGFAYNKTVQAESNTPGDYTWSLFAGGDGVEGPPGADGTPRYMWVRYSDNPDGSGMYDAPNAGTLYIGIAPNKETEIESANYLDYTWSRMKGEQGVPGQDGSPGSPGDPGTDGDSRRICYSKTTLTSLASAPATIETAGSSSFPSNGSWGADTVWGASPHQPLAEGESDYQSDGIYYAALDKTIWSVPYLSHLKVGSLESITHKTGSLEVTGTMSTANGLFSVNETGVMTVKSGTTGTRSEVRHNGLFLYKNGAPKAVFGEWGAA